MQSRTQLHGGVPTQSDRRNGRSPGIEEIECCYEECVLTRSSGPPHASAFVMGA